MMADKLLSLTRETLEGLSLLPALTTCIENNRFNTNSVGSRLQAALIARWLLEVVDKASVRKCQKYGKATLTWSEEIFEEY